MPPMSQIVKLGLALAALYAVDRAFRAPARRKSVDWVEVSDNAFAERDAFGRYLGCVDKDGNKLPDSACFKCGIWGSGGLGTVIGCPGDDGPDSELE